MLLFNACAKLANDEALKLVKTYSSDLRLPRMPNIRLTNSLMDAFIKCGDYDNAEKIFRKTPKSVIGYGNLMNGFNGDKQPEKTLTLYEELKRSDITANEVIFLLVIQALSQVKIGRIAHDIIGEMPKTMRADRLIQTSLISMWVSCSVDMVFHESAPVSSCK